MMTYIRKWGACSVKNVSKWDGCTGWERVASWKLKPLEMDRKWGACTVKNVRKWAGCTVGKG